ncbi:MAG: hypothetical protein R3F49_07165 [Planctomycetota bacterium]
MRLDALSPAVLDDIRLADGTPREARRRFQAHLEGGARIAPVGMARDEPEQLLAPSTRPIASLELFGHAVFLSRPLFDPHLGFMVAFVGRREGAERRVRTFWPRIFYKDISLVWRAATHVIHCPEEDWVGKGAVRWERDGDELVATSAEETTDLPYEVQAALDAASRLAKPRRDDSAALLVLRNAPAGRMEPYADFTRARARDQAVASIHRGRPIARFVVENDPESLVFARGFEPDFDAGLLSSSEAASNLYGGRVTKTRVLSTNRKVQYQFISSPTHVWINPPQALTTALTPYATRTLDVIAPPELFVPGFEYHFMDHSVDPPALHTQIPPGFAGAPSAEDPMRADAAAWIERLPPVVAFRRAMGLPTVRRFKTRKP